MKKIILLFLVLIFACACAKQDKFLLEDTYYGNGSLVEVTTNDIENKLNSKESFLLFTYNNYCTLDIPCEDIFEEFTKKYQLSILSIPYDDFKKTSLHQKVKYAPSVLIIKEGKIVSYLDANAESDLKKYQDIEAFDSWIKEYINLK